MPFTINGIGTTYAGKTVIEERISTCEKCGKIVSLSTYETRLWICVLFIPVIPLQRKLVLDYCPKCTGHGVMSYEDWQLLKERIGEREEPGIEEESPPDIRTAMGRFVGLAAVGKHEEAEAEAGEIEKRFSGDEAAMLQIGNYFYKRGLEERAEVFYEHVLKINPQNTDARNTLARLCIKRDRLPRARDLLSFMTKKFVLKDIDTLMLLAKAYQRKQDHYRALEYFRVISRDFPTYAKSNGKFRKAVKQSEKYTGSPETILPKGPLIPKKHRLPMVFGVLAILLAAFVIYTLLNPTKTLQIINRMKAPATVTLPEKASITVASGEHRVVRVPLGQYDVQVRLEGGSVEKVPVNIPAENDVYILNVCGGAVITWEQSTYSNTPDPNIKDSFKLFTGDRFLSIAYPDYCFEEFPERISTSSSGSFTKTRVGVLEYTPEELISTILMGDLQAAKIMDYFETHLPDYPDSESLLSVYTTMALAEKNWQRCRDFIEQYLDRRPVWIEWHRFYQGLFRGSDRDTEILKIYDDMLVKEPENSGLLYLRGRIEKDSKQAFQYYDRAMEKNPRNPYPYHAKAHHIFSRGDLKGARNLWATACKLLPSSYKMEEYFYLVRLGLNEYDNLEKELAVKYKRQIKNWDYFNRLLQVRIAANNKKGARELLTRFMRILRTDDPVDSNQYQLLSRMYFNYYICEFDHLQSGARKLKNETDRNDYFRIVYFNKGKLQEVEKLLKAQESVSYDTALLLYLGWLKKGNPKKASHWLRQSIAVLGEAERIDKRVSRWLEKPGRNILIRLDELESDIDTRRLLYTVFAQRYPPLRKQLLKRAKALNIPRHFPYHFLKGIHETM